MTSNDFGPLHRTLYDLETFLEEQVRLARAVRQPANAAALERAYHLAQWAHMQCHELSGTPFED